MTTPVRRVLSGDSVDTIPIHPAGRPMGEAESVAELDRAHCRPTAFQARPRILRFRDGSAETAATVSYRRRRSCPKGMK